MPPCGYVLFQFFFIENLLVTTSVICLKHLTIWFSKKNMLCFIYMFICETGYICFPGGHCVRRIEFVLTMFVDNTQ